MQKRRVTLEVSALGKRKSFIHTRPSHPVAPGRENSGVCVLATPGSEEIYVLGANVKQDDTVGVTEKRSGRTMFYPRKF
jgi:hypothetical protein